jgi:hypothetical protein
MLEGRWARTAALLVAFTALIAFLSAAVVMLISVARTAVDWLRRKEER